MCVGRPDIARTYATINTDPLTIDSLTVTWLEFGYRSHRDAISLRISRDLEGS